MRSDHGCCAEAFQKRDSAGSSGLRQAAKHGSTGALLASGAYQSRVPAWIRSRRHPPPLEDEVSLGKKRKILQKILAGSKNVRFEDFLTLVEAVGFILERIQGSHRIYKHPHVPDLLSLQPSQEGQAKPYQMRQFLRLMEEYQLRLLEDSDDEKE